MTLPIMIWRPWVALVSRNLALPLLLCFVEVWLDETSNKLLEMSLLLEQSLERLDETLQHIEEIKQDYDHQGFARLSIQENIERSQAKRPFTRCEQGSLREKHDTVLHMVEVVHRSLQEKYNSKQRPKVKYFKHHDLTSPLTAIAIVVNQNES